jgi:nitrate/nitrite transporter NarK
VGDPVAGPGRAPVSIGHPGDASLSSGDLGDASLPRRAAFGGVLALAMATGTFPGYAFGVLGPQLVATFGLSRFELGLLTASFFLVGGVLSLIAGQAVDRFGGKRVMGISFVVTGGALLGMAIAPAYPILLAMAALAGVAVAAGNPLTNKLIALNLLPGRRGLTMGAKQAGVQVGAFVAGALLAPLAVALGWRVALGWSAVIPFLAVLAGVLVIPSDRHSPHVGQDRTGGPAPSRVGQLPVGVRWLAVYAFLMGSGVSAVNAYLPLYLVEVGGASPALAGAVVALIGLTGIISRVAWGWWSERLRGFALPLIALGAGAVVAVGMILAVQVVGLSAAWAAALVFGATAVTWNAVGMLAVLAVTGPRSAGIASGLVLTGFYIGFVGSPLVFGWMVDRVGGYAPAWLMIAAVFAAATLVVVAWQRTDRTPVLVSVAA